MAITKPLVFTNIGIADANGSNVTYYPLHVSESATVTLTPVTDTVEDGQTLTASFDLAFEAVSFNANLYSDARVYTNTTANPTRATIILSGANGAQTLNIGGVYVTGNRVFDGNRTGIQITASKRAVSGDLLVSLT
jgi:hypothetical protein